METHVRQPPLRSPRDSGFGTGIGTACHVAGLSLWVLESDGGVRTKSKSEHPGGGQRVGNVAVAGKSPTLGVRSVKTVHYK